MSKPYAALIILMFLLSASTGLATDTVNGAHSLLDQKPAQAKKYPAIVLYSVAWCPHCKEAKEYMTEHNIPFINKDVEIDAKAMEEVTGKYNSQSVPVIVLGHDEKILKGFNKEKFETALKELVR